MSLSNFNKYGLSIAGHCISYMYTSDSVCKNSVFIPLFNLILPFAELPEEVYTSSCTCQHSQRGQGVKILQEGDPLNPVGIQPNLATCLLNV